MHYVSVFILSAGDRDLKVKLGDEMCFYPHDKCL